jgi:thiamine pyrophosphate-dependent acetolactate synthase large subunit-like protein
MNRLEAIKIIVDLIHSDELMIHANGAISRESFFCKDRKENFYLLGSMGLASSVALGVAINHPNRRVITLDGDGNLLMGFGNLALIGSISPSNLVHVVLDNHAYGTTGNQPTISSKLSLDKIALSSGYKCSVLADTPQTLLEAIYQSLHQPGPHFVLVKVSREVPQSCPRIPFSAEEMKKRFKSSINTHGSQ